MARLQGKRYSNPMQHGTIVLETLEQLMARAANGDDRAVAQLYHRTSSQLYAIAIRIVRRCDWAEDVVQDAFIKIVYHLGEYDSRISAPMTWMIAILRNQALDCRRRKILDEGHEHYERLAREMPDTGPTPEEIVMEMEDARAANVCLSQLPLLQRQALILAYKYGLTHPEIAKQLQQPLGTTKAWIRRGLLRLKTCMESPEPVRGDRVLEEVR